MFLNFYYFKYGSYFSAQISFYSQISVTLDELQTIADSLRPYTANAMKIEVAPWIKEYVVDMEELYTELTLEKIHNKVAGQNCKVIRIGKRVQPVTSKARQ